MPPARRPPRAQTVASTDDGDERGQPDRQRQRAARRPDQPGRRRAQAGEQPLLAQHTDQRPHRERAEQRLRVRHAEHDAHRRGGEQGDEQQPGPARPAGYQLGEPDQPERRHHAGHGRHEQRGGDEVPAGQQPDGGDRRGIAGEERVRRVRRVPAERVDERDGHVVVAVVRDVEQPDGVPAAQRRDQRYVVPGRHDAEHGDPDGAHGEVDSGGGEGGRDGAEAPRSATRAPGGRCVAGRCCARGATAMRAGPVSGRAASGSSVDAATAAALRGRSPVCTSRFCTGSPSTCGGTPQDGFDRPHRNPVPEHGRVPGRRELGPVDAEGRNAAATTARPGARDPSRILSATARPSGSAAANTPSAPSFATSPGTAAASRTTSRPVPATHHGCARTRRRPGPPGCRATRSRCRANARASPAGVLENSGAPQPSTAVCATGTPVRSSTVVRTARCRG